MSLPTMTPELPPHRSYDTDELVEMMRKTPLFMTSLEDAGVEGEENVELEAIRALQYDGTPEENAQSFKEQGNEMVKKKRWTDAKEFYTRGLAALVNRIGQAQDDDSPDQDSKVGAKERGIEEACYVNRALCHLELKNYRSSTLDCASALRINTRNIKAFYRSSRALLALDKLNEAYNACQHGLAVDPANSALTSLLGQISARAKSVSAIQQRKTQEAQRLQREKMTLIAALRARDLRLRKTAERPDMEDARIHLAPDPLSPTSCLHFPLLFLYPMDAQSDFIKAFPETDTLSQHLEYILPLPWDAEGKYQVQNVEGFIETINGGLSKVGKNLSLLKILGNKDVEVVDELVRVSIVPKQDVRKWIDDLRARKGK